MSKVEDRIEGRLIDPLVECVAELSRRYSAGFARVALDQLPRDTNGRLPEHQAGAALELAGLNFEPSRLRKLPRGGSRFPALVNLKGGDFARQLRRGVRRGVSVDLLVHDTERRVPSELVDDLIEAGVRVTRIRHAEDLPMHAKFLLVDQAGERSAWLGSHNFNKKSLRRNAELLLRTEDGPVIAALDRRFDQIRALGA